MRVLGPTTKAMRFLVALGLVCRPRPRLGLCIGLGLGLGFAEGSAWAGPWEDLIGKEEPRLFTDPKGRFYLDLPDGWRADAREDAATVVDFWRRHPDLGYVAHVTIEVRSLPPNVRLIHFDARVEEEVQRAAPGYRLIEADKLRVSGVDARRRFFTYRERNHADLQNEVVQTTLIVGERGFVITLETAIGARGPFWDDFQRMLAGFVGRAPGDESMLPKSPKRIRSGEMVNPDAIKY